jgi:hypothetical protein
MTAQADASDANVLCASRPSKVPLKILFSGEPILASGSNRVIAGGDPGNRDRRKAIPQPARGSQATLKLAIFRDR